MDLEDDNCVVNLDDSRLFIEFFSTCFHLAEMSSSSLILCVAIGPH